MQRIALVFVMMLASAMAVAAQDGRGAAPQQGRGGGRGAQPGLEPRILRFDANPLRVRAGKPVLLTWQTENPAGVTIEPGVGAVFAGGSRQVTPSAKTTYTLTMKGGLR